MNLNFMAAPVHGCYYLSTDCFYVEINIEGSTGRIAEAKVHHIDSNNHSNQTSSSKNCPEIIECLTKGQFTKFVDHLEGLMAIYDLPNASAQDKTRGWNALSTLENDILRIDNQRCGFAESDIANKINHGGLGLVQPRAGGLPMKLTFFIPPKDQIDTASKTFRKLSPATINEHHIGLSATIGLEKIETPRPLPIHSLIMSDGKEVPLSQHNSVSLPARFVLELEQEMALEIGKLQDIINITGIDFMPSGNESLTPLFQLVSKQASNGVLDSSNNRGLFVVSFSCFCDEKNAFFSLTYVVVKCDVKCNHVILFFSDTS